MRTFRYNQHGNAEISVWSLIRDQVINATASVATEPIPINHRNQSGLIAQIDGTAFDVKVFMEVYDGLVERTGVVRVKPDQLDRVVLPAKYFGRIDDITTVVQVGGDGTDYYSGGSFDNETGVIAPGTNLPDTTEVEVTFEYDDIASSPADLQAAIDAAKVSPIETSVMEVMALSGTSPLFFANEISSPPYAYCRFRIDGQAGNGVDTVISLRMSGVLLTRTM